jgi:RimJ/RimL family protein N-acetyltransferase
VAGGEPLGLVAVTSPNFRDGFAYISALGTPQMQGSGLVAEAALLCFHYAFLVWPFRKIYMEASEESFAAFRSAKDVLFREEGRLRQHSFWNGRYIDLMILAVYREDWERASERYLAQLGC